MYGNEYPQYEEKSNVKRNVLYINYKYILRKNRDPVTEGLLLG